MAVGRIKTAHEARLVGGELLHAVYEIAVGIQMTGDPDPMKILSTLEAVGNDLIQWAEGKQDNEEVFIPTARLAAIDQASAQFNEFVNKNHN